MTTTKRLLALALLLLGAVGFVLGIAGIAGVWVAHQRLTESSDRVFGRADQTLDRITHSLKEVHEILAKADADLKEIKTGSAQTKDDPEKTRSFRARALQKVAKEMSPQIGDLGGVLQSVTEAALLTNSILDNLQELPVEQAPALDREQLHDISARVSGLAASTQELAGLLGESSPATAADVDKQTSRMEEALARTTALVAEYETRATDTRSKLTALKAKVDFWLPLTAVLLTVALVWFALSQVCLFARGWSLLRGYSNSRAS